MLPDLFVRHQRLVLPIARTDVPTCTFPPHVFARPDGPAPGQRWRDRLSGFLVGLALLGGVWALGRGGW
jgi:hypothetical protein